MTDHTHIWDTPDAYLADMQPDQPVHFFVPSALDAAFQCFRHGFAGLVTYAVKANPDRRVLAQLIAAGIDGFDVASPDEIALVRSLSPDIRLHYHNPVRSRAEIATAAAAGIASWSVDTMGELEKILPHINENCQIAVRFKLPVAGAAYDFGAKFGATPSEAVALLQAVAKTGAQPALTFHPGTQCDDAGAYAAYIHTAADIAKRAAVQIRALNVGGGFPCDTAGGAPRLEAHFAAIRTAMAAFETAPELACEPGRAMVASAFGLAVRVKSLRGDTVYLNDGIYGGLAEFRAMDLPRGQRVLTSQGTIRQGQDVARHAFGPTCDSIDKLPLDLTLPDTLREGDYILFSAMGAYVIGLTALFNGYGALETATVRRLS
ncbi:MAG: type III PLP-dependent enzyme [Paracoccaceae bacterium]